MERRSVGLVEYRRIGIARPLQVQLAVYLSRVVPAVEFDSLSALLLDDDQTAQASVVIREDCAERRKREKRP